MKRSVKARKIPRASEIQSAELRRNGYTRKDGSGKRSQASELNRRKK